MASHRKLWIGCFGCLGVFVLVCILLVSGGWLLFSHVSKTVSEYSQQFHELYQDYHGLNQEFEFTPPADGKIEEERFQAFLQIRDELGGVLEQEVGWMIIGETTETVGMESMSAMQKVSKFVSLPKSFLEIGKQQVGKLKAAQMSHEEYRYHTGTMANEILSWAKGEGLEAYQPYCERYVEFFKSFRKGNERGFQFRTDRRNASFDPTNYQYFVACLRDFEDPEHKNRELIQTHAERILAKTTTILADSWNMQMEMSEDQPPSWSDHE